MSRIHAVCSEIKLKGKFTLGCKQKQIHYVNIEWFHLMAAVILYLTCNHKKYYLNNSHTTTKSFEFLYKKDNDTPYILTKLGPVNQSTLKIHH